MNFRSYSDLAATISAKVHMIPRDVDVIIGIPRSGLLAANILALQLNLPLADLDGFAAGRLLGRGTSRGTAGRIADAGEARHALILDDSILTGNAMHQARAKLGALGTTTKLTYAAVYGGPWVKDEVDFYLESCPLPRIFAWNYLHHPQLLKTSCVDIDGILCLDPSEADNDDGPAYDRFLRTATPLNLPTVEIGWLVTSRLAKYRPQTEAWLRENGVRYRELVMLENYTAEQRRREGVHGKFKAGVYASVPAELFIESEPGQAEEIARLAGKPVLCGPLQTIFEPSLIARARHIETWRTMLKRVARDLGLLGYLKKIFRPQGK